MRNRRLSTGKDRDSHSTTAGSMPASRIREIMEIAWADPETIHLEVGEPDFATPPHVVEAAHRAALSGHTRYTPNAGIPELREALAEKVSARNGYRATPERILVTQGGVEALYSTLLVLLNRGDEILLPDPAWPNFRMISHLLGARAVTYPLVPENGFLPQLETLEKLVSPRTRTILVNSPSNPLGAVIPAGLMQELLDFARRHDLWLISDEVYDEIVFDDTFTSAGTLAAPEDKLVSIYSFSKVYAMTGWRVGYAVAPLDLAPLLSRVQEPIISCVNTPAQKAALAALTGPQDIVVSMREAYQSRRDRLVQLIRSEGLPAVCPSGAFYVWADISDIGIPSMQFARHLVEDWRVALAPGSAFGDLGEGYMRLSLASSEENLLSGAKRIAQAVEQLRAVAKNE